MQSFLQYRRFGRHVEAQYKRDQEKAKVLGPGSNDTSGTSSPSSSATDARDSERAEQSNREDGDPLHTSATDPVPADEAFENAGMGRRSLSRSLNAQRSIGTVLGMTLTGIDVRRRRTKEGGGAGDVFVVGYEGERDDMNPHNWSRWTRIGAT